MMGWESEGRTDVGEMVKGAVPLMLKTICDSPVWASALVICWYSEPESELLVSVTVKVGR